MSRIDTSIYLGKGFVSDASILGRYYQDTTPAMVHIREELYAKLDENDIPYFKKGENRDYTPMLVIQYGLMSHDLILKQVSIDENHNSLRACMHWLDENKITFYDSVVWRVNENKQYNLPQGWISGMYQGQALSLYLRAFQMYKDEHYLKTAKLIFNSFQYDYEEGGFKRIDEHGCLWFEEYPTSTPSYVLNGYIYSILGIYDYYRVTKDEKALKIWNDCLHTLKTNLHKYDVWYWSVYDQLKEQLASYYYQKNVHVPLMQIMYQLTGDEMYNHYAVKWEKSLNNPIHRTITKIMYRIQPRLKKLK